MVDGSKERLEQSLKGDIPEGYELTYYERKGLEHKKPLLLEKEVLLNNEMVKEAAIGASIPQRVFIRITLTPEGKTLFAEVTGKNVGRRLAVVLDGKVLCAPSIRTKISAGEGVIEGEFTLEDARDLTAIFQSPNLPVPVRIVGRKERKVLGTVRTSAAGLYDQANMLYRRREYKDAVKGFEKLLQQYPKNEKVPTALRLLGTTYYQQGQYQMCLETLQELISQSPEQEESDEAQRTIYSCYVAMERYDNALSWANEIVESYEERELPPGFGQSSLLAAKYVIGLVDNNGDYSGKPLALFWKAETYTLRKQREKAEETYREILTKYPNSKIVDNVQMRIMSLRMARVHRKRWERKELTDEESKELKKEYLKVAEEFKGIIEKYPEGDAAPTGYFSLAGIYKMIGESEDASSAYNTIIQKFPESPWADAAKESLGRIRARPAR